MKIKGNYVVSAFLSLTLIAGCTAIRPNIEPGVSEKEASAFSTVVSDVSLLDKQYGPKNILIVLDIDNTILTGSVDLGSDVWYQWQSGKLDIKPKESQKVACLYEDSIGLLYELAPMRLTEGDVPQIISDWQKSGNTVIALTSRAPKYRAATERELVSKKIHMELAALAPVGQEPPTYRETKGREISYMKGILMTSGLNKGKMLRYILEKTNRKFDAVVFVDDTEKNIKAVYSEYQFDNSVNMNLFHYTHIERQRIKKYGAILTQKQAVKMDADWKELNRTLNKLFPARNIRHACLGVN